MKNRVLLAERPKTLVIPYLKDVDKDTFLSMMLDSTMDESLREVIVRAINVYYQSNIDNVYDANGNITAIVIGRP